MEKLKKTEIKILAILWLMSLTTYSIAIFNSYNLLTSDYLGLVGLATVTLISYFKPERSFLSVFILLLIGLFNLMSFAYFFNLVFSFRVFVIRTPGIQLISLVLLSILILSKRKIIWDLYQNYFQQTEAERQQSRLNAHKRFRMKFENLSDKEIELKLQEDLVPEAISALKELREERKNAIKQQ